MKIKITFLVALLLNVFALAQAPATKIKWTTKPFDHKVFIENKGQFTAPLQHNDRILYGAQIGKVFAFITDHGIIYNYTELPKRHIEKGKDDDGDHDEMARKIKALPHYLYATWQGSGNDITTFTEEKQTNYYTYAIRKQSGVKANIFKKVTCKNIYPGIDIEYTFPKDKGGIKYNLIVHPGADLSAAKLKYTGEKNMKADAKGNIEINTSWGHFIDHAPQVYYAENNGKVGSEYTLNDNEESVRLNNADPTKTLVIDPWSTNWIQGTNIVSTTGNDAAYDVDYDYKGNVYVYGGDPMQLVKFNSSGTVLWTFNTSSTFTSPGLYGSFCVDRESGSCYVTDGLSGPTAVAITKLNNAGIVVNSINSSDTMYEYWRSRFDQCNHQVVIGGGGCVYMGPTNHQTAIIDTNLSITTPVNILHLATDYRDICGVTMSPGYKACYMVSVARQPDSTRIVKASLPTLSPVIYDKGDTASFQELSINYNYGACGMNCVAANFSNVYVYNGITLQQYNESNGSLVHTTTLPGTLLWDWGGMDVDLAGNLYVGNQNTIYTYNSSMVQTGTMNIGVSDSIYDIKLGQREFTGFDSLLYVCGSNFVASIQLNPPTSTIAFTKTHTTACGCNSTATGTLSFSGMVADSTLLSYLWSDGQTTQTATNLCAGTYTLTISAGCHMQFQDTFHISSSSLVITKSQTPITCATPGTASVNVTGGINPYTYLWSNGATTSAITELNAGNYCVTVSNFGGCLDSVCFNLTQDINSPIAAFSYSPQSPGIDQPLVYFTDKSTDNQGIESWTWNFGITDTVSHLQNPTFKYPDTGRYCISLLVVNKTGCKDSITHCLNIMPAINLYIPDAFTPNGNNLNETFGPVGTGMLSYSMYIFNRWGDEIYSTSNSQPWNGSIGGSKAQEDTYVYQINALDNKQLIHTYVGKVVVLK